MLSHSERLRVLSRACGAIVALDPVAANVWLARNAIAESPAAAVERRSSRKAGVTAVLPLYGYLMPHASELETVFGASSTVAFGEAFDALVQDEQVKAIVLDVDSPGGDVTGLEALSSRIYDARRRKKIVAVSNGLNASAAYYISSAAGEVVVDADSLTGSIGTVYEHADLTGALEQQGVKLDYITYGDYKAELAPGVPLSEEARDYLQGIVNSYGKDFEGRVAQNRRTTLTHVRESYGQGRVLRAKDAVAVGMADRVGSLQDVIRELSTPREPAREPAAAEQRYRQVMAGLALNLSGRRQARAASPRGGRG